MLSAFLCLNLGFGLIFGLVALDLHALVNDGHHKGVIGLLEILSGNAAEQFSEFDNCCIIEFLQSLSFHWSDGFVLLPLEMYFSWSTFWPLSCTPFHVFLYIQFPL
jgi:hypothetical protein